MIKSKIDAREEAARLAAGAKNFGRRATEIYNFIVDGIDLPDTYNETDYLDRLAGMMSAPLSALNAVSAEPKPKKTAKEK